mmetsp:Transcript_10404/g.26180  ORF Transcript_10404/g.26180 Transcript_10404/m.26180 type:complete len:295 (+) Transcript_10404:207-1091(+)
MDGNQFLVHEEICTETWFSTSIKEANDQRELELESPARFSNPATNHHTSSSASLFFSFSPSFSTNSPTFNQWPITPALCPATFSRGPMISGRRCSSSCSASRVFACSSPGSVCFDLDEDGEIVRELGKGAYGQVLLGRVRKSGASVAIKRSIGGGNDDYCASLLMGHELAEAALGSLLTETKLLGEQAGAWRLYFARTESGEEVLVREYADSAVDHSAASKPNDKATMDQLREFRWEVWLMSAVQHPNMVKLVGYSVSPAASILMEVVHGGELYKQLHDPLALKLEDLLCGYKG